MSNIIETPRPSLLSDQSLGVVQATAAVVAAHADEITAHFYPRMFAANPELLRVFNMGNQRGDARPRDDLDGLVDGFSHERSTSNQP